MRTPRDRGTEQKSQCSVNCGQAAKLTCGNPVNASVPSNTFVISGNGEDKELTELVPGILNQLGPDSLASLRKLAESYQAMQKNEKGEDDDEIPDLVEGENFESKVE